MFNNYNPYNYYNNYNRYNPYEQQYGQFNNQQQAQQTQTQQQIYRQPTIGLQGKSVDSIDVVKAMDIPLDGSISYFPLTDGTAILTKQLQSDGTSKTIIYKPVENTNKSNNYITADTLKEELKNVNNKDIKEIKEEIKTIKREIRDITDDLKDKKED